MATFEGHEYVVDARGRPVWVGAPFEHLSKMRDAPWSAPVPSKDASFGGPCWQWTGATTNGTPVMRDHPPVEGGRGRLCQARRLVYHWLVGPILPGRKVRDFCGNPMCVNPNHLRLGYPGRKRAEVSQ
jgi:hypothetical protein